MTDLQARPLWLVGLASAVAAAVASVLVYVVARAFGVPMELTEIFEDHFARMPVQNMAWAALLDGGVTGTVLATVCRRYARRPRSTFVALTTLGLAASLVLPILSDASPDTKVVLSISHLVVAAFIVPALALALPRRHHPAHGAHPALYLSRTAGWCPIAAPLRVVRRGQRP